MDKYWIPPMYKMNYHMTVTDEAWYSTALKHFQNKKVLPYAKYLKKCQEM